MRYHQACGQDCETEETWIVYAGRDMRLEDYLVEKREFKKKILKIDENNPFKPDHIIAERNKIQAAWTDKLQLPISDDDQFLVKSIMQDMCPEIKPQKYLFY